MPYQAIGAAKYGASRVYGLNAKVGTGAALAENFRGSIDNDQAHFG